MNPHASRAGTVVIGTGSIGFRHLSVLHQGGYPVTALPKRMERVAELQKLGFNVTGSLAAARAGNRHAIVASDTRLHAADTVAALEHAMDVLVEKPLAARLDEALPIRSAALTHQRRVFVGCTLRFSESLNVFREWLPKVGRLSAARLEAQSYLPDWRPQRDYHQSYSASAAEGGVLRDLIHEIDYAGWIFGWPGKVQATLGNLGRLGIEAEETADVSWIRSDGAAVSIRLDYLSRPTRRRALATGENGELEWDGIEQTVRFRSANGESEEFRSSQTRDEMLLAQDAAFLEACSDGSVPSRLASLEDGLWALAICDAARRSSTTRREENVVSL